MSALLQVDALSKYFPLKRHFSVRDWLGGERKGPLLQAVDRVSFEIRSGETVGLVGESGCGKSTLVRLVTRLLDPTDGRIVFDGEDIGALPAKGFGGRPQRATIQMVFQDAGDSLNPRYTAYDCIADPLRRLRKDLRGGALKSRVEECADLTGLPRELLTRFPHQLSGGQKARVGIARAIAVEPKLLILDEPTSALDVSVQVVILHLLDDLKKRLGMSYLFVSHDLNVVQLLCDRVLVMYLGHIVESGPVREVFRNPAHPYTRALISAIPDPAGGRAQLRLGGEPRSPIDPDPNVCRFYGRCPKGAERCHAELPRLVSAGPERLAACHFPEKAAAHDEKPPQERVHARNAI
ncbi:MAG: ABC transporter ATP-binding protein [Rhodospirillales bacterium]